MHGIRNHYIAVKLYVIYAACSDWSALFQVAVSAVRAAFKTELFDRSDTIIIFLFAANKKYFFGLL